MIKIGSNIFRDEFLLSGVKHKNDNFGNIMSRRLSYIHEDGFKNSIDNKYKSNKYPSKEGDKYE